MQIAPHDIPRIGLATLPTPLEPAPRLAAAIGLGPADLWIKRDDLTGLGGGGNKVRKLQYTCGAAVAAGATVLITTGAPQSNHARLTAAAAARLGLDAVLVLAGGPGPADTGNIALDGLLGASVVWAGDEPPADRVPEVVARLQAGGATPFVIPFGGSSVDGARGYVECADELRAQLPGIAHVVTAAGSCATMAGLVSGLGSERVLGIDVGTVPDACDRVAAFVAGLTGRSQPPEELRMRDDQIGTGYPYLTEQVAAALELVARTEGVVLDPIYTGRAAAGLCSAVAEGSIRPGEPTVLLHSGGLPGFFGHPDAVALGITALAGTGHR